MDEKGGQNNIYKGENQRKNGKKDSIGLAYRAEEK